MFAASVGVGGDIPLVAAATERRAGWVCYRFVEAAIETPVRDSATAVAIGTDVIGDRRGAIPLHVERSDRITGRQSLDFGLKTAGVLPRVVDYIKVSERAVDGGGLCCDRQTGARRDDCR